MRQIGENKSMEPAEDKELEPSEGNDRPNLYPTFGSTGSTSPGGDEKDPYPSWASADRADWEPQGTT